MSTKAVGLFSGGLDSCLAVKLIQRQGIEVTCMVCDLWRHPKTEDDNYPLQAMVEELGAEYKYVDLSNDYPAILLSPRWGYGTAVNPCIDCKYLMMTRAAKMMDKIGASFVFTGEVLGQRPMTQNKVSMDLLQRKSGLGGRLVRPLCGALLPPTVPEEEGILDRSLLLDIQGRSRQRQLKMAKELGLKGYGAPGGGCILTQYEYGAKVQDYLLNCDSGKLSPADLELFKIGRHFRISANAKVIVGKNLEDNNRLEEHREGRIVLEVADFPGPIVLLDGNSSVKDIETAAAITVRYSKAKGQTNVDVNIEGYEVLDKLNVDSITEDELDRYRIEFNRGALDIYLKEIKKKSE